MTISETDKTLSLSKSWVGLERRITLLGSVHAYGSVCFFVFGLIYWFYVSSLYMLISNFMFGALCGLNWVVHRRVGYVRFFTTSFLAVVYLGLVNVVVHLGGHNSPLMFWGLSVLVAAAFIYNLRGIAIWAVLCLGFYPLCLYLKRGWFAQRAISLDAYQSALLDAATYVGVGLFLGFTCLIFQRKINKTLIALGARTEELKKAQQDLERRVEERTAELRGAHRELRESERLIENAQKLESLGVLAGGIAHDFNNLLAVISGNLELAEHATPKNSSVAHNLANVRMAVKRAADLVDQVLAYSGKGRVVTGDVDVNALVSEMISLISSAGSWEATLQLQAGRALPLARGDATQIRQVVLNLITNAREALCKGPGEITIVTDSVDLDRTALDRIRPDEEIPAGEYLRLRIRDNGTGLDAEARVRIFDPFYTTKGSGSGLGLAVVHGIVRSHRGAVTVESEPGQGTEFTVLLPAVIQCDGPSASVESVLTAPWRGEGTVLVVDDEDLVRGFARDALETFGYGVVLASNGPEGVALFREHAESLVCVLLDMRMPEMDGEQVFNALREIRAEVPVVLCSGFADEETTIRMAVNGLAASLKKPYSLVALRRTLRSVSGEAD
jgi:signal transduction histidine kinase/CheY-like chemotaxis protein